MPQSALSTKTQSMLDATAVGAFAGWVPDVPDPQGSPNAGSGARQELAGVGQWQPVRDGEEGGVQCEEMEYLWRNQME